VTCQHLNWIGLDEVCELYLLSFLQAASIIIHLCATGFAAVHVRWRDVGLCDEWHFFEED
jgi:hypothetical protein